MPVKTKIYTFLIALLVALTGCGINASGTYMYEPIEDVTFKIDTTKLKYKSKIEHVFLYFELNVENNSDKEIYFNFGEMQANLNGEISTSVHYDSLGSGLPQKEKLKKGQTKLKLYFVFSKEQKDKKLKEFKVIKYGLS